jgi:hypothetical protein
MIKLGVMFQLKDDLQGKITEAFSQGFNYHTLDKKGNCVKVQQYMLNVDFEGKYEVLN